MTPPPLTPDEWFADAVQRLGNEHAQTVAEIEHQAEVEANVDGAEQAFLIFLAALADAGALTVVGLLAGAQILSLVTAIGLSVAVTALVIVVCAFNRHINPYYARFLADEHLNARLAAADAHLREGIEYCLSERERMLGRPPSPPQINRPP